MIAKKFFNFNSIAIFIGVLGGLSAVATLFIDVNSLVSTKWVLFLVLISLTLLTILTKINFDLANEKEKEPRVFEKPIKSRGQDNILVIRVNPFFNYNSLVGGYFVTDEVETLAFIGYVFHIQEKIIQIKVIKILYDEGGNFGLLDAQNMHKITIRPVITFDALNRIGEEL